MSFDKKIKQWKEEGNRVREIETDDGKSLFFKMPGKKAMKLLMAKARVSPIDYGEAFVKNCYLGGDLTKEELLAEDGLEYINQIAATLDDIVKLKKATIKKH